MRPPWSGWIRGIARRCEGIPGVLWLDALTTGDRLAGYLDDLGPGVALQDGAVGVGRAVLAILDTLRSA